MSETCVKVLEAAKEYWTTSPDVRALRYAWLETHLEDCQGCAEKIQDVAEALLDSRRKS